MFDCVIPTREGRHGKLFSFKPDFKDFKAPGQRSEIIKKAPFVYDDSRAFVLNNRFVEVADSTKHYFLNIHQAIPAGDTEPFEYAKENIASIMFNRKKTEFILSFEKNIYDDAIKKGNVNFIKKKKN